jgi:ubiquitin-protein ligase
MSNFVISKKNLKRLLKDVAEIIKNPLNDEGIYYVHDETDMFKGYAMIIGPEGTPYEGGYYFFKFRFSNEYPFKPPKVIYCTNDGKTRFNPNLYKTGKVCVSILNTWKGETWTSCQNIRSVLLTLVTLLNDNPLTNEPGFPPSNKYCKPYKRQIEYMNFKIAIMRTLKFKENSMPPEFIGFKPVIIKHFKEKKEVISKRISSLVNSEYDNKEDYVSVYNMRLTYNYNKLNNEFNDLIKNY